MDFPLSRLGTPEAMRIDAVCAVFLSDPESYDGGELIINSSTAPMPLKLPVGNAVVFPATDFHTTRAANAGSQSAASRAPCGVRANAKY